MPKSPCARVFPRHLSPPSIGRVRENIVRDLDDDIRRHGRTVEAVLRDEDLSRCRDTVVGVGKAMRDGPRSRTIRMRVAGMFDARIEGFSRPTFVNDARSCVCAVDSRSLRVTRGSSSRASKSRETAWLKCSGA